MIYRIVCLSFFSLVLCVTACNGEPITPPGQVSAVSVSSPEGLLPLVPAQRDKAIALSFVHILEQMHISQRPLDETVSKEAFRIFIKSLDPSKMYFYQSDIDEFKRKYELKLCELVKKQDVKPAFEIYNRYLDRVKERADMIAKILSAPLDFTQDEYFVRDKSREFTLDENVIQQKGLQRFPATPEEAYDRWRKRLKVDILVLKSDALEEKKKQEKKAENKELQQAETKKAGVKKTDEDPVERLKKRYVSFRKRMLFEGHIESKTLLDDVRKAANDEVLETVLTAIGSAFDPHTAYMSPSTLESFNTMMGKRLEGIGATLTSEDGYTVIQAIVKGGPADKSGLLAVNDKIRGVGQGKDGKIEDIVDFKLSDVVKQIRGAKGTVVRLEIVPVDGGTSKVIEIVRDEVKLADKAAKSEIFESGKKTDGTPYKIGFIGLPDFYLDMDALRRGDPNARSTTTDIKKMLGDFVQQNVDAVILDLRKNGGGSLSEAISLTGLFIDSGNVVQTKDETSSRPQQRDDVDPSCDWTGPLVVLTSKFSASASEIFAGAVKDYKRGLIIGDTVTHGKGTVQQMQDISERIFSSDKSSLGVGKITIQGFYRPSGISTQRIGVAADVILPSASETYEDICEADLDNALTFNKVAPAAHFTPRTDYVTQQITAELQKKADERVAGSEDFRKLQSQMAAYKELRAKKTTPLNETQYLAEQERLNTDKLEKHELEDLLDDEAKIKKDYYVDETLSLTVDYLKYLQESGIQFPKERQNVQRSGWGTGWKLFGM
ncbi:MAG: carboxy terminal-processing peptidase [Planctomycetaceae bacterium]|jgi:carboxyl-terminal processing protease|nr:carboxy terminal-processing peptidase [Planctomycetaceae bacterium]